MKEAAFLFHSIFTRSGNIVLAFISINPRVRLRTAPWLGSIGLVVEMLDESGDSIPNPLFSESSGIAGGGIARSDSHDGMVGDESIPVEVSAVVPPDCA